MNSKPWYASKTIWASLLVMLALIVQAVTGAEPLPAEVQAAIVAVVMFLLRLVTKQPIG